MKDKKRSTRLRIFDFTRDGKGVSKKDADMAPGLKRYFVGYRNHFSKLVSVNIFMVLGNFPLFFVIAALAGVTQRPRSLPLADLFQNLSGILTATGDATPFSMNLLAIGGMQSAALAPTWATYLFFAIGALTFLTFGPVNAGTAYILRNMVKGEPIFLWSDFWYAVKRNLKQAWIFGAIDLLCCVLLTANIGSLVNATGDFLYSVLFWGNIAIFIAFFVMRFYIYLQIVTFDLSIFKILKNSLIFTLLGFKRNLLAILGILLGICFEIAFLFAANGFLIPVAIIAPLTMLFSTFAYMKVYAAYFKIKAYMIDPYYQEHPQETPRAEDATPIMRDDVTDRERLEEIKRKNGISDR